MDEIDLKQLKFTALGSKSLEKSADKFAQRLNRLGDLLEGNVNAVMRKTAIDLFTNIVRGTPADTGRARASWQIDFVKGEEVEDEGFNQTGKAKNSRGISEMRDSITRFASKSGVGQDTMYIYNNLEYIQYLEYGTPRIEPFAMVGKALRKSNSILQKNINIAKLQGGL